MPEVPFRGGGFAPRERGWAAAATLLGSVLLWQAGASAGLIPTLFLPAPVSIARALYGLTISGALWADLSVSLMRLAVGWVTGTLDSRIAIVAVHCGCELLGRARVGRQALG